MSDGLGGYRETGRQVKGPASTLIELEGEDGAKYMAVQFRKEYRQHEALTRAVELALGFLEFPMVVGVVDLSRHMPEEGAFIYQAGTAWTLTEVLRQYREAGKTLGVRAAMDLCYLAAGILQEAAENGPSQGVFSHGGLTPDRILVDGSGFVHLLGYGLPQIEVLANLRGDVKKIVPREESWRYCPPERITGAGEDVDADLYALALIAWECITGEPLYKGEPDEVKRAASQGEGALLLRKLPKRKRPAPQAVIDFLIGTLEFDPNQRYEDGHEFVRVLYETFTQHELAGDSLQEIMARLGPAPKRGRALVSAGPTKVGGKKAAGARRGPPPTGMGGVLRAPGRPGAPSAEGEDGEARWGRAHRGRGASEPEEEEAAKPKRRSARRRGAKKEATAPAELPGPAPEEEAAKPKRRTPRRAPRRASASQEAPAEAAPAEEAAAGSPAKPKRRTPRRTPRRAASSASSDGAPAEAAAKPKPKPKRRTPRRAPRKSTSSDD